MALDLVIGRMRHYLSDSLRAPVGGEDSESRRSLLTVGQAATNSGPAAGRGADVRWRLWLGVTQRDRVQRDEG